MWKYMKLLNIQVFTGKEYNCLHCVVFYLQRHVFKTSQKIISKIIVISMAKKMNYAAENEKVARRT